MLRSKSTLNLNSRPTVLALDLTDMRELIVYAFRFLSEQARYQLQSDQIQTGRRSELSFQIRFVNSKTRSTASC